MKLKSFLLSLFVAFAVSGGIASAHNEEEIASLYEKYSERSDSCWARVQRIISEEEIPFFDFNVGEERVRCASLFRKARSVHHYCHQLHSEPSCLRYHPNGYVPGAQNSAPTPASKPDAEPKADVPPADGSFWGGIIVLCALIYMLLKFRSSRKKRTALISCPKCETAIYRMSSAAVDCPKCGHPITGVETKTEGAKE